jgi:hypothetical protein
MERAHLAGDGGGVWAQVFLEDCPLIRNRKQSISHSGSISVGANNHF